MKHTSVIIHIDTTGIRVAQVGLSVDGKKYAKEMASDTLRSQAVLPLIQDLIKEANITLAEVTGITVAIGPGSFTGLRVGLAIANMLGTLLAVPINSKRTLATPQYS